MAVFPTDSRETWFTTAVNRDYTVWAKLPRRIDVEIPLVQPNQKASPPMDVIVTADLDGKVWMMTDLLGRDMGHVRESKLGRFVIEPAGQAVKTMMALKSESYPSLDAALAAIEVHTRGVCRLA